MVQHDLQSETPREGSWRSARHRKAPEHGYQAGREARRQEQHAKAAPARYRHLHRQSCDEGIQGRGEGRAERMRAARRGAATKLIIEEQGYEIPVQGVILDSDAVDSRAHKLGLDSAYTLNIELDSGAGRWLCLKLIIELNCHAGRRRIHNLARVISAPDDRAAERGDGAAQVTAVFALITGHPDILYMPHQNSMEADNNA